MKKEINKATAKKVLKTGMLEFTDYFIIPRGDATTKIVSFLKYSNDRQLLAVVNYYYDEFPDFDFSRYEKESSDVRTDNDIQEEENIELPFTPVLRDLEEIEEETFVDYSTLDEKQLVDYTHDAIENMGKNFLEIAALLYTAKRRIDHGEFVYVDHILTGASVTDIYDYGKRNFGFSRGTVSDYVNIADRFLKRWGTTNKNFFTPMPALKLEYKGYSVSQLQALLPIKDNNFILMNCSPSMTVRELKVLAKQWKEGTELLENPHPDNEGDNENEEPIETDNLDDSITSENSVSGGAVSTQSVKTYTFSSFDDYNGNLDNMDTKISNLLKSGKKLEISINVIS